MKHNPNKVASANARGIVIYPGDKKKHHWMAYPAESPLRQIQTLNLSKYQVVENRLSPDQIVLLNEALYGLTQYPSTKVHTLSLAERARISDLHDRAQRVILQWKLDIVNNTVDKLLLALFPNSPIVKSITGMDTEGVTTCNQFTLADLGITKDMIARKLVDQGILPSDYYQTCA
jgi:hypothetical protein